VSQFNVKRISDPVHGSIGLSQVELDIIETASFQRLRNVKQLGLAYYVFPGADYSRFSHSLGVCHVTGRILEALRENGAPIETADIQQYRLAALCHDIGHYPFSHATEHAVENYYKGRLFTANDSGSDVSASAQLGDSEPIFNHETLGKEILKRDPVIREILKGANFTDETISSVFVRGTDTPPIYANIVSSDLDADRIDYLLRTARHTGLPYGSVDLDYLLSQMTLDNEQHVCITEKALRTADHFLLCRYFDFQQVAYHKTVAALELVLQDVLTSLLQKGWLDCSEQALLKLIEQGGWGSVDDVYAVDLIRKLELDADTDGITKVKAHSILKRNPPKLLVQMEAIEDRSDASTQNFRSKIHNVKTGIEGWASHFGIPRDLWYIWHRSIPLTKMGSRLPVSTFDVGTSDKDKDKYAQSIRVLSGDKRKSTPISEMPHSLMSVLANQELHSLRLYVLFTPQTVALRPQIAQRIKTDLPFIGW